MPGSPDFALERRPTGRQGVTLLAASGDIDMTTSAEFGRRLAEAITASPGDVVLDLLDVVYLDSTALRALLAARKLTERRGRGFALVCEPKTVGHVLEVSGLAAMFEIHADRDGALEAIGRDTQPKR